LPFGIRKGDGIVGEGRNFIRPNWKIGDHNKNEEKEQQTSPVLDRRGYYWFYINRKARGAETASKATYLLPHKDWGGGSGKRKVDNRRKRKAEKQKSFEPSIRNEQKLRGTDCLKVTEKKSTNRVEGGQSQRKVNAVGLQDPGKKRS